MAQSPSRKQEFLPQPQSKRQQRFVKVRPALPRARAGTHGPEGAGRPVAAVAPAMVGRLADATPPHLCDALEARTRTATANIDAVFRFRDARNHKSSPQFAATACSLSLSLSLSLCSGASAEGAPKNGRLESPNAKALLRTLQPKIF